MRKRARSTWIRFVILPACLAGMIPSRASAQHPNAADALNMATAALNQATGARGLAQPTVPPFAVPLNNARAEHRASADAARVAALGAGDHAIAAAQLAVAAANAINQPAPAPAPTPGQLAATLGVIYAARAAAERADAAVQAARGAYQDALFAAVRNPADARIAVASRALAEAHHREALLNDVQVAAQNQRVADLGAAPSASYDRAMAENQQAEAARALTAFFAQQVPAAAMHPAPPAGAVFLLQGINGNLPPFDANINYNLRREPVEFQVVNGSSTGAAIPNIVPVNRANPPARITVEFAFTHQRSGTLTIPRRTRIRLLLNNGSYAFSDDDKRTIARDFIATMNEVDRTFSAANPIDAKDVTITVTPDNNASSTITGSLRFVPGLTNTRDD